MAKQDRWRVLGALALIAVPLAAQNFDLEIAQGRALTSTAAQQLEASLTISPNDFKARATLLGYYSAHASQDPQSRGARLRQLEWLIQHEPASPLLRNPAARLQESDYAAPYDSYRDSLRTAWREQVDRYPDDAVIIENAWDSVAGTEFNVLTGTNISSTDYSAGRTSAEYLKRLRNLDPGDPEWAFDLAATYSLILVHSAAPGASADAKQLAALALASCPNHLTWPQSG